jgi:hypothetical protein
MTLEELASLLDHIGDNETKIHMKKSEILWMVKKLKEANSIIYAVADNKDVYGDFAKLWLEEIYGEMEV